MRDQIFYLNPASKKTLQVQIREMLVVAILDGHIPGGEQVPSPRKLGEKLGVARNTVMEAYRQLVEDGYLSARERSGYYVSEQAPEGRTEPEVTADADVNPCSELDWSRRFVLPLEVQRNIVKPRDWLAYTYPFVSGQMDMSLFPAAHWRECCRYTVNNASIPAWASDHFDTDTLALVDQLRTRVLPRRGIYAAPEEILVTLGAQHALYLLGSLLMRGKHVGIEDPGYPDARNIFTLHAGQVTGLPMDEQGLLVGSHLAACDYVYVTPGHQAPTTVTLSAQRSLDLLAAAEAYDFVIIEDDYEGDVGFYGKPVPALRSLGRRGRVIYIGSLSKTFAPGLRQGYMVGAEELVQEARALRRLMLRHAPGNNESAIALFLARGHHDTLLRRLGRAYHERWLVMRAALDEFLPGFHSAAAASGTSFWLQGPAGLDCRQLQRRAARESILIEPGDVYFMHAPQPLNYFRLGLSCIPVERIRPGIEKLAQVLAAMGALHTDQDGIQS